MQQQGRTAVAMTSLSAGSWATIGFAFRVLIILSLCATLVLFYNLHAMNSLPLSDKMLLVQSHREQFDKVPRRLHLLEFRQNVDSAVRRPPDASYNVNVTASELIPLDRHIPDTRPKHCLRHNATHFLDATDTTTIVIPFYNEALSLLLRCVYSIIQRTPEKLLRQIILVDDASENADLRESLRDHISSLHKVRLLRSDIRLGLIRARLLGAEVAHHSKVLVFLDAHTEVNVGWLEPLIEQIRLQPDSIVQPFIDGIDPDNLAYAAPQEIFRGAFTWDLRYVWIRAPALVEKNALEFGIPFPAPSLVGCALAMRRSYFEKLGGFDAGMEVWGGENIELSLRCWMCGGSVVTVPCSRVGHMFRTLPYRNQTSWASSWQLNLMRIADLWFDHYRRYFYSSTRVYHNRRVEYSKEQLQSLQARFRLKAKLKCHNFEWYLRNIFPELPIPSHDALQHGEVTSMNSQGCWYLLPDSKVLGITYLCYEHKTLVENIFTLTYSGLLTLQDRCVTVRFPSPFLVVVDCPHKVPDSNFGIWSLKYFDSRWTQIVIKLPQGSWCVTQVTSVLPPHVNIQMPQMASCNRLDKFQIWDFTYRFDFNDGFASNLTLSSH